MGPPLPSHAEPQRHAGRRTNLVFKIADDNGLLLLTKDLRAGCGARHDHGKEFQTQYGNISAASAG
jgi:hypothetical protein